MFRYCMLDLDGTVTDSSPGIINSVLYALSRMGIREEDREKLKAFVGPPLSESFGTLYGMGAEEAARAISLYRAYYAPKGIYENAVYEGVPAMLEALRAAGKKVVLVTSKPELFAVRILEHFGLSGLFDGVYGATMDEVTRSEKIDVMRYAMRDLGIRDPGEAVMAGDRKYDVEAANALGIPSVGVLYGYGSREELERAGAAFLAESPEALAGLLLGETG
ncbi:MAG: HAD hydrolase-like protein [Lachnospiraceae bacterium]|nr:HAD hydrolase-like protein [Lachnospiraceae bacterium]MBP5255021.1 HAD hydrolase-like protein [Lachnospiraceae bacterium]